MTRSAIYAEDKAPNADHRLGQTAGDYWQAWVFEDGQDPYPVLLTGNQMETGKKRAADNPEDVRPFEDQQVVITAELDTTEPTFWDNYGWLIHQAIGAALVCAGVLLDRVL